MVELSAPVIAVVSHPSASWSQLETHELSWVRSTVADATGAMTTANTNATTRVQPNNLFITPSQSSSRTCAATRALDREKKKIANHLRCNT